MVLRCTARLLKLLPIRPTADLLAGPDDWYANLLWIDRRKNLLLVHADTLFAVFVRDVRQADLSAFGKLAAGEVARALADDGLPPEQLGSLDPNSVILAATASRQTLGFMNDMTFHARYAAERAGGLYALDVLALNRFLRQTPYHRGGYFRPIDATRER